MVFFLEQPPGLRHWNSPSVAQEGLHIGQNLSIPLICFVTQDQQIGLHSNTTVSYSSN